MIGQGYAKRLQGCDRAGPKKLFDLLGKIGSDPVDLVERMPVRDLRNVFIQSQQGVRSPPVGADAIRIGSLSGQELGDRSEECGKPLIALGRGH